MRRNGGRRPARVLGAAAAAVVLALSAVAASSEPEPGGDAVSDTDAQGDVERKFGLTLAQRKAIYVELAAAERRAETEAQKDVDEPPESMEQVDRTQRLARKYKAAVAARHGLTEEQAVAISVEGTDGEWNVE